MSNWYSVLLLVIFITGCASKPGVREARSNPDSPFDTLGHVFLGRKIAIDQVHEALANQELEVTSDTLITDASIAIAMVEPLLFRIYGKQQITSEKPYETYLIDNYWYLSGTIPSGWHGGGFEVIMSANNGKIIRVTHYK